MAAILNSSLAAWYFDLNGRKFGNGYHEVGVSLLRRFPIPDLRDVSSSVVRRVIENMNVLMDSYEKFDHERASALDEIVLRDLYRLEMDDMELLTSGAHL